MNASLSEDSVADTAISKRNSDGMLFMIIRLKYKNTKSVPRKINEITNQTIHSFCVFKFE